jgi:hypothetical protein
MNGLYKLLLEEMKRYQRDTGISPTVIYMNEETIYYIKKNNSTLLMPQNKIIIKNELRNNEFAFGRGTLNQNFQRV